MRSFYVVLTAMIACAGAVRPSSGQGLIACNLPPFTGGACSLELPLGQDSVQFSVQVLVPLPGPLSPDTPRVTIGSSACCIQPQVAKVDPNGFVSTTWRGVRRPEAPVTVTFAAQTPLGLQTGVVTIRSQPAAQRIISVRPNPEDTRYVWIRGDRIPVRIPIPVRSVDGVLTQPVCESVRVVFRARMEGKADPDTTLARWDDDEAECAAFTRWKLADDAGEQDLDVTVGGTGSMIAQRFTVKAYARQTPRLTGGFAHFWDMRFEEEVTCGQARDLARCEGREDSVEVTRVSRRDRFSPFFAVEMPLLLGHRAGNPISQYVSKHVRLTFGATFERPEDNFFAGVTLFPLLFPASEASPFQLSAGITRRGFKSPYMGFSLDATAFVKPVLTVLGVPGL